MSISRRQFVVGLGAASAAASAPAVAAKILETPERLYPPMDLSYFDVPIPHGPSAVKIGYASITWNRNDRQAIDDISALGYPGIQLRANVLEEFPDPHALRDLLAERHLTFVALSSNGGCPLDPSSAGQSHCNACKECALSARSGREIFATGRHLSERTVYFRGL